MAPTFSDYITFRIIKLLPLGQIFECRKLNRKLKKSIDSNLILKIKIVLF